MSQPHTSPYVQALFFISELISSYLYGKYFIHGAISPALCYMLLKLSFLCVLFYCVCVVCVCTCRYVWAWVYPGASRGHRHWIWSCSYKRCELPNLGAVNLDPLEQLLPLRVLSPVSSCIFFGYRIYYVACLCLSFSQGYWCYRHAPVHLGVLWLFRTGCLLSSSCDYGDESCGHCIWPGRPLECFVPLVLGVRLGVLFMLNHCALPQSYIPSSRNF